MERRPGLIPMTAMARHNSLSFCSSDASHNFFIPGYGPAVYSTPDTQ